MADPVAGAAISAGGALAGGGIDAIGQGRANQREAKLSARHAKTLSEFVESSVLGGGMTREDAARGGLNESVLAGKYTGLEARANQLITRGQQGLNASLGGSGLTGSGAHVARSVDMRSQVLSNLASEINQDVLARQEMLAGDRLARSQMFAADQFGRSQLAAQIFSDPSFGFYDPESGAPTNQGK